MERGRDCGQDVIFMPDAWESVETLRWPATSERASAGSITSAMSACLLMEKKPGKDAFGDVSPVIAGKLRSAIRGSGLPVRSLMKTAGID